MFAKKIIFLLFFVSPLCYAQGWTSWATPTQIDLIRNDGFMIFGSFGNSGNCTIANNFFVPIDHPQYNELYATALAAFASGKRIRAYIDTCRPVMWYSSQSTTYNVMSATSTLNISN